MHHGYRLSELNIQMLGSHGFLMKAKMTFEPDTLEDAPLTMTVECQLESLPVQTPAEWTEWVAAVLRRRLEMPQPI